MAMSFSTKNGKGVVIMTYANDKERGSLIAGLRDLADFLERRPGVPAPKWADLMVFPTGGTDSDMRREIDGIAALIGSGIDDQVPGYDHYTTSRSFGPVQYRAVAIPARNRTDRDVRMPNPEEALPLIDGEA
jgi:hypothetical protein